MISHIVIHSIVSETMKALMALTLVLWAACIFYVKFDFYEDYYSFLPSGLKLQFITQSVMLQQISSLQILGALFIGILLIYSQNIYRAVKHG